MFEVQILIPVASNAGQTFDPAHHTAFEAVAVALFGGITLLPAEAAGAWVEATVVYHDQTRIYMVSLKSIGDGGKVAELVAFAKVHYDQKAIYIRYLGLNEIL